MPRAMTPTLSPRRLTGAALCLLAGLGLGLGHGPAQAQDIARLYAAQAPAGSAYVRVVNASTQPLQVEFGGKRESLDGAKRQVSDYRIIDAAAAMPVKANGKRLAPVALKPGSFNTLIVSAGKATLVADATDTRNDLKAELRFYNLVAGCDAGLALLQGPVVFSGVGYQADAKRNINPVKAELVASCQGGATSHPFAMPALKAGDHVSFFLSGDNQNLRLAGQVDATEAASGAR